MLDNYGMKKCERCLCFCNKIIRYGDILIGKNFFEKKGIVVVFFFFIRKENKYWMGGE